jgi:hypothetical protein
MSYWGWLTQDISAAIAKGIIEPGKNHRMLYFLTPNPQKPKALPATNQKSRGIVGNATTLAGSLRLGKMMFFEPKTRLSSQTSE